MKRQSYNVTGHAHFLTFTTYKRRQLLIDAPVFRLLADCINNARNTESFLLYSYVFMPEHVHLLIHPTEEEYSVSKILRRIKEPFTKDLVSYWKRHSPARLSMLRVKHGVRRLHRFWQVGGGYDRNLYGSDIITRAIQYIEYNPVRRGLASEPEAWPWSSAAWRAGRTDVVIQIDEIRTV